MNKKIKLHVGCGTLYKDGWINIDNNSDNNIEKLDINHDLSTGLPFEDLTVDYIYNEHFIEHLSYEDGFKFLEECHRVLKIGGVLRISCPDLDKIIDGYINDTWKEEHWVTDYHYEWIESGCQMLNLNLNETPWGHKYVYNKEELVNQLTKVGFNPEEISEKFFSQSLEVALENIDTRLDGMFFEATKTTHMPFKKLPNNITYSRYIQLFLNIGDNYNEDNSLIYPVSQYKGMQTFTFNLVDKVNIKSLRLDPLNEYCIIEIKNLYIKNNEEELDLLPYMYSNAEISFKQSYLFTTNDPQIYFSDELDKNIFKNTQKLIIVLQYIYISEDTLSVMKGLAQELEDKEHSIQVLTQELNLIHLSKIWRYTKPLRGISKFLKKNRS